MSAAPTLESRGGLSRERFISWLFVAFLVLSLLTGFVMLGALLVDVFQKGVRELSWAFLTNPPSSLPSRAGARPAPAPPGATPLN